MDSQGFARLWERIRETLGEDLQDFGRGFMRLWERFARICETFREDSQGFVGICETLGEDLWGFTRLWERIHKDS